MQVETTVINHMHRSLTRHTQSHGTGTLTASTQIISHKQRWHKNKSNDCSYTGQDWDDDALYNLRSRV